MNKIEKTNVKSKITKETISLILREYNYNLKIQSITDIEHGVANPVYIIKTQNGEMVLRVLNPIAGDWKPQKEKIVYDLLKKKNILVPEILKIDISKRIIPYNYIISKKLEGKPLIEVHKNMDGGDKEKIVRQLGKYSGMMHSITFNKFGDVMEQNDETIVGGANELSDLSSDINSGPYKNWKEMHWEILKSRFHYFKNTEFEHLINPIQKYFKDNEHLIDYNITPRLLHLDLNMGNILVKDNTITGILDVEESLVGHNEYDLMRTELHFENENLRKVFFEEYVKYVKLDDGYEKRRSFYSLSRTLVGVRCLILLGSSYSKERYENEKNYILNNIKKILETNNID